MNTMKEILSWMGVLGVPTVFCIFGWVTSTLKSYNNKLNILMGAVQAQMRSDLLRQYYKAKEQGFISSEDLDEWENQYQSYHALGQNGVLDKRRDELFDMPTKLEE